MNTAASGNNAAAIQSLDDRVTAELASKLDTRAGASNCAPSNGGSSRDMRRVNKVVDNYKTRYSFFISNFLDASVILLLLDDTPQRHLVPPVPTRLLPLCVHPQTS